MLITLCLFGHFHIIPASNNPATYSPPPDNIVISCGSSASSRMMDGRVWTGDSGSRSSLPLQIIGKSSNSRAIHQLYSPDSLLYNTARASSHEFSYVFHVKPGQIFIRLHFFQDSYKGFKGSKALFTVKVGPYTLLSNFSTSPASDDLSAKQIIKEYCVNVDEGKTLTITFSPAQRNRKSDDFFAFVNGIEVVSMPTGLYFSRDGEAGALVVGRKHRFYIDNSTALELVQRLNVGGAPISPVEDSSLFRRWDEDSDYLLETGALPVNSLTTKANLSYSMNTIAAVLTALLAILNVAVYHIARVVDSNAQRNKKPSSTESLCRQFSIDEIQRSTNNFDPQLNIGSGGYGRVYKGRIDYGATVVAIKRMKPECRHGDSQFGTEIEMLTKVRHVHLVSLIGYCNDGQERVLIYQYMTRGTLSDHLYKMSRHGKSNPPLSWELRLKISIGAARGLYYLHSRHRIIHRDVKSSNILLDENWVAKISDFGLSKMGPANDSFTHISTNVKGTFGYLDPEYYLTRMLTRKSDVYSFGVVLFEVISGRPAVNTRLDEEQHSLAGWARYCIREAKVDRLVDHNLKGKISPASLKVFVGIAGRCLQTQPKGRPTMADVVMALELALQLQQTKDPTEQVEEEENVERTESSQSDGVISMDDISLPKGESDRIISEYNPSSSTRNRGSDQKNGKTKAKENGSSNTSTTRWWWDPLRIFPRTTSKSKASQQLLQVQIHQFSLQEIHSATNNFHDSLIIRYGGQDSVYKGCIDGGKKFVAIRRLRATESRLSMVHELQSKKEIQMKFSPTQDHVASLLGYCETESEMILVYSYMVNGTLYDHLHEASKDPLPWKRRLQICIGAARGLIYVHSTIKQTVLHRELKSTNIWLDEHWNPKISEWGLTTKRGNNQVPTIVRSNGAYLDSEYIWGDQITEKSYVYSFGLVLFEVLFADKESDRWLEEDQVILVQWIKSCMKSNLSGYIDPFLVGRTSPDSLKIFIETAGRCLLDYGNDRPSMINIVTRLEEALKQQDATEGNKGIQLRSFLLTFNVSSTDDVSINCGSTGTSSSPSGRQWLGDVQPKASPLLQLKGLSKTSTAIRKLTSADPIPYNTARVSTSRFSYAFQVNPGQIIIRLHFNPSAYKGFKGLKDLFTVEAGPFTLLGNFSASLTANALRMNSLTKEFCLNIQENQLFHISFSAETSQSKDAYAFINGIEIISVPASLSYIQGGDFGLQVVGRNSLVNVDNSIALQIIHQFNTKQDLISYHHDSDDIFGMTWKMSVDKEIGNSKNVSWKISVDVGFQYMVRLHFSKIGLKMAETGALKFKVFINEMNADTNSDIVVRERDGSSIPWYGDYMVMMNGRKQEGKRDLLICLQSDEEFMDGPLKGFEILKLSNPDNSLASPIPIPPPQDSTSSTIQILLKVLGNRIAIGTVAITILSIVCFVVHKLRGISEASSSEEVYKPSARAEQICRRFSLSEMQLATRNFSVGLLIGRGAFGEVYKGLIDKEKNHVAIKRLKSNSRQGSREFLMEIETLSELQHINLVSLIGYCNERREMILVYEYMSRGTLGDHLYNFSRRGIDASSLTWKQRLNICIGAARGLDYLHTGHRVIHRDVKPSNILLDDNFVAKVSDLGLAEAEDRSKLQSHGTTKVKGTFGYLDPYYYLSGTLTTKSDTYSFGVVLLEALCGRPSVDSVVSEDERTLTFWARDKISKGEANQIVDSSLRDEISPNSLEVFVRVAIKCLEDDPNNRPTMSQVVFQLELALEQRDSRNLVVSSIHIDEIVHDVFPSNEDRVEISSVSSKDVRTDTFPPTKHTNTSYLSGKNDGRKQKTYSASRFTAWNTFWYRINPIKSTLSETRAGGIKLPSDLCRHFSLDDIKSATHKFSAKHVIGKGGFGRLYKGVIDGATSVAIKRLSSSSNQGVHEFVNEIKILSKLRHLHLISLIGYCYEKGEKFLVYDYMARGSLRDHLYDSENSPLTWKQRLQICLGAAKGLHYLHTGLEQTIMHRDVMSRHILLNEKWEAKISKFSQSKVCPSGGDDTLNTTFIQGTFGYLDPEYLQSTQLTDKSDVYSFGVTLFEVLCARPPINPTLPLEQRNLAAWATSCYREGTLGNIIDSNVKGQIAPECLKEFAGTAAACLRPQAIGRPSMRDVVLSLKFAIKFQETTDRVHISS
ncbi:hypothetical protein ACS0TY_029144 [Phlomoides rotata]